MQGLQLCLCEKGGSVGGGFNCLALSWGGWHCSDTLRLLLLPPPLLLLLLLFLLLARRKWSLELLLRVGERGGGCSWGLAL
jgi:hypothetical protein